MTNPTLEYRCLSCESTTTEWASYCVVCGSSRGLKLVNGRIGPPKPPPDPCAELAIGGAERDAQGYRIKTGIEGLDRVLGRPRKGTDADCGLHVPSVVLLAGPPGTGKTTLLLQMFAEMGARERRLFISSEQTRGEIADNIDDLGLTDRLADLPVLATEDWQEARDVMARIDPRVVVIDSHNKLRNPLFHNPADRDAASLALLTDIRTDAFANERAVFVIAHLNKKMEMRGTKELEHDVSALMMLFRTAGSNRIRCVCPDKNRFGKTGVVAWFEMGDEGMTEIDPEEVRREEEQKKHDKQLARELDNFAPGELAQRGGDDDDRVPF